MVRHDLHPSTADYFWPPHFLSKCCHPIPATFFNISGTTFVASCIVTTGEALTNAGSGHSPPRTGTTRAAKMPDDDGIRDAERYDTCNATSAGCHSQSNPIEDIHTFGRPIFTRRRLPSASTPRHARTSCPVQGCIRPGSLIDSAPPPSAWMLPRVPALRIRCVLRPIGGLTQMGQTELDWDHTMPNAAPTRKVLHLLRVCSCQVVPSFSCQLSESTTAVYTPPAYTYLPGSSLSPGRRSDVASFSHIFFLGASYSPFYLFPCVPCFSVFLSETGHIVCLRSVPSACLCIMWYSAGHSSCCIYIIERYRPPRSFAPVQGGVLPIMFLHFALL